MALAVDLKSLNFFSCAITAEELYSDIAVRPPFSHKIALGLQTHARKAEF